MTPMATTQEMTCYAWWRPNYLKSREVGWLIAWAERSFPSCFQERLPATFFPIWKAYGHRLNNLHFGCAERIVETPLVALIVAMRHKARAPGTGKSPSAQLPENSR